jgi:hypothetical protein
MPKAVYKLIRMHSGADPVFITAKLAIKTSAQIKQHLLCFDCEQRFSKAEKYALRVCNRGRGKFRLRDAVGASVPTPEDADVTVISTIGNKNVDIPTLVYFASTVFWRASVFPWRMYGADMAIDLGRRYEEEFRQYLLGEAEFPANASMWIILALSEHPHFLIVSTPKLFNKDEWYQYECGIPGLLFHLFLGKRVSTVIREMCSMRSPEQNVYVAKQTEQMLTHAMANLSRTAKFSKNVNFHR